MTLMNLVGNRRLRIGRVFSVNRYSAEGYGDIRGVQNFIGGGSYANPGHLNSPAIRVRSMVCLPSIGGGIPKEMCPWFGQSQQPRVHFSRIRAVDVLPGFWINSIFRLPDWNNNFFHWHRNFLTHLTVLLDEGFTDVKVVVQDSASAYKSASLEALGLQPSQIVPFEKVRGKALENVLSVEGADRQIGSQVADFVHPSILQALGTRIRAHFGMDSPVQKVDLYLMRGDVGDRRVRNENDVRAYLSRNGNFRSVNPGGLSYAEQVALFASARRVIGMHGGALTNLLFGQNLSVLEMSAAGHGSRPDFWPFVVGGGGSWALAELPSINSLNDVMVPLPLLEWWMSEPERNYSEIISLSQVGH